MLPINRIPLTPWQTAECEKMAVRYLRQLRRLRNRLVALRIPIRHPMWLVLAGAWDAGTRRLLPSLPGLHEKTESRDVTWDQPLPSRQTVNEDDASGPPPLEGETARAALGVRWHADRNGADRDPPSPHQAAPNELRRAASGCVDRVA